MNKTEIAEFELATLELLKTVMDPEIEINIVDLGLIYELYYNGAEKINIVMTFSTPACPLGETIISNIKEKPIKLTGFLFFKVQMLTYCRLSHNSRP